MNTNLTNTATLLGRILLAVIFIASGWGKITGYEGTAAYMNSAGLPLVGVLLPLTIATELGGGLLLAIGYKARWAALLIFLFLIPVTIVFHGFWAVEPQQAQTQMINFMKNLAIMGGMLMVFAHGPGAYSVDKR